MAAFKDLQITCSFDLSKPDLNGRIYSIDAVKKACESFSEEKFLPIVVNNFGRHFELGKTTSLELDEEKKLLVVRGTLNSGGTTETCKLQQEGENLNVVDIDFKSISFVSSLPVILPREEK